MYRLLRDQDKVNSLQQKTPKTTREREKRKREREREQKSLSERWCSGVRDMFLIITLAMIFMILNTPVSSSLHFSGFDSR